MTLEENRQLVEQALAALVSDIPELQVTGYYNPNPTPPAIDMYPADPSQDEAGFGVDSQQVFWTIRARVNVADDLAAQQVLLRLLEPGTGVAAALATDDLNVQEWSGYREYPDMVDGRVLGCEWRIQAFL